MREAGGGAVGEVDHGGGEEHEVDRGRSREQHCAERPAAEQVAGDEARDEHDPEGDLGSDDDGNEHALCFSTVELK